MLRHQVLSCIEGIGRNLDAPHAEQHSARSSYAVANLEGLFLSLRHLPLYHANAEVCRHDLHEAQAHILRDVVGFIGIDGEDGPGVVELIQAASF